MLCTICEEIFNGTRPPLLDGSFVAHFDSPTQLMEGVRKRCFICSALGRVISPNGKLEIAGEQSGFSEFLSEYFMSGETGNLIQLEFRIHYTSHHDSALGYHVFSVRPWNGKGCPAAMAPLPPFPGLCAKSIYL